MDNRENYYLQNIKNLLKIEDEEKRLDALDHELYNPTERPVRLADIDYYIMELEAQLIAAKEVIILLRKKNVKLLDDSIKASNRSMGTMLTALLNVDDPQKMAKAFIDARPEDFENGEDDSSGP